MPELPEVETITNALRPHLIGRSFTEIHEFVPALRYPLDLADNPNLLNSPVTALRRRARYSVIELQNRWCLIFHYGMTGAVRIVPPKTPRLKHEHVTFVLDNGLELRFEDPRRFGSIQAEKLPDNSDDPASLFHLGPEPFDEEVTGNYLKKAFENKKLPIKQALMDNKIVVGIGNIYANESLFLAHINPKTPAQRISAKRLTVLLDFARKTLKSSILAGGTTIADFKGVDGQEGKFALNLNVYGREKEDCKVCGSAIQRIVQGGRSTFFCPNCQKR